MDLSWGVPRDLAKARRFGRRDTELSQCLVRAGENRTRWRDPMNPGLFHKTGDWWNPEDAWNCRVEHLSFDLRLAYTMPIV